VSYYGLIPRPDGGSGLLPLHGHGEMTIRQDPKKLTIVIKEDVGYVDLETRLTENDNGEWEIVFRPFEGEGCSRLGCVLWHPWLVYMERVPRWSLEEAIALVTRGIDLATKNWEFQCYANYAIRHVHTGEIIPREIPCA